MAESELRVRLFWVSFKTWFGEEINVTKFLKEEYIYYDAGWNGGTNRLSINYDHEFTLHRGHKCPKSLDTENANFENVKEFLELAYEQWILKGKRYDFTIALNKRFDDYKLPFQMTSGKIIKRGYRARNTTDIIVNEKMFEDKIRFSEEEIASPNLLDKKAGLKYLIDAMQYIISLTPEAGEKKLAFLARSVKDDENSKVYAVIKTELKEIKKISNEFFDIRHNECLNSHGEHREVLEDKRFVEYLYNRVHALLDLLRQKHIVQR